VVTIYDVAAKAGVSPATVSRVSTASRWDRHWLKQSARLRRSSALCPTATPGGYA